MLTPDGVRDAMFGKPPIGKRGYNEDEVDEFLDLLESTLRGTGAHVTGAQVRAVAFGRPPIGKRGYDMDEVDAFLDLAAAQLDGEPAPRAPQPPQAPQLEATTPGLVEPKKRWWKR